MPDKAREDFDVKILPPRKAKGRYRKGEGFNRGLRAQRRPVRGDRLCWSEETIWLRT
jgi:hypothetical protein